MNSPNPGNIGYTSLAQATMDFMIEEGPGRDDFVRYWKLMVGALGFFLGNVFSAL